MILTSTSRNSLSLPVVAAGTDVWWLQYAIPLADIEPGTELHARGKIQGKNYNTFDVEFRCGLFVQDGLFNPTSSSGVLHPLTGENIGPAVSDKYNVADEAWSFSMPSGLSEPFLVFRVSLRSTQSTSTTRIQFGNGYLQLTD